MGANWFKCPDNEANNFGIKVKHKLWAPRFSRSLLTSPANVLGKRPVGYGRFVIGITTVITFNMDIYLMS